MIDIALCTARTRPAATPIREVPLAVYATAAAALRAAAPYNSRVATLDPSRLLADRFGFGAGRPGADPTSPDDWFDGQLQLGRARAPYGGVAGLDSALPTLHMTPVQTRQWLVRVVGDERAMDAVHQLEGATAALQAWSDTPLYEATVDVFSNLLNVASSDQGVWCGRGDYDRTVIRANAFGTYSDMLVAAARHPAMLNFLGNAWSSKASPNENYGREILELHSVGEESGFTQADVVDSARILTGRTIDFPRSAYEYNPNMHWVGPVSVLGFSEDNADGPGGEACGDRYVRYLAAHPATARRVARVLCVRFVADDPDDALVQAVATAYLQNDTAIVPMLSTIVRSDQFWRSLGGKFRRPTDSVAAAVRALGASPGRNLADAAAGLRAALYDAGQVPLAWGAPNGYPDVAAAWCSAGTLAAVWQFQSDLAAGAVPGVVTDEPGTYGCDPQVASVGDVLDAMTRTVLGRPVAAAELAAICAFFGEPDSAPFRGSALSSDLRTATALLLHSPAHAMR